MVDQAKNWMKPEEALSRFEVPQENQLSKQGESLKSESTRYGFVIDDLGFLIAENTLSEVVKNSKIYPVPNTQNWMKGLINLRGNLIPVYDFSVLLGLDVDKNKLDNLLVLGKDSYSVGVLINSLPKPCDVGSWQKLPELPENVKSLNDYVEDAYLSDDIVWMDFDEKGYFESIKQKVVI